MPTRMGNACSARRIIGHATPSQADGACSLSASFAMSSPSEHSTWHPQKTALATESRQRPRMEAGGDAKTENLLWTAARADSASFCFAAGSNARVEVLDEVASLPSRGLCYAARPPPCLV
jgi:hypothetical protein